MTDDAQTLLDRAEQARRLSRTVTDAPTVAVMTAYAEECEAKAKDCDPNASDVEPGT